MRWVVTDGLQPETRLSQSFRKAPREGVKALYAEANKGMHLGEVCT
jgi:hypothetical protein